MGIFEAMMKKAMATVSPHMREIGLVIETMKKGVAVARVPYRESLVGDPSTGVLHGGVVTSLLDSTGGAAVMSAVGQPIPIATLDLRIDYLRPATPGSTLYARVECYKVTRHVAFTRGTAYVEGEEDDPVASMVATFMLRTAAVRKEKKA